MDLLLRISTDLTTTDPCTLAEVVVDVVEATAPTTSPSTLTEMVTGRLTSMSQAGEAVEVVTGVDSEATGVVKEVDTEVIVAEIEAAAVDSEETAAIILAMEGTEETMVASEAPGVIVEIAVVSGESAVDSAVTEVTWVDSEAVVAEAITEVAIKAIWEGKIKRIKSTVSIRMTLQVEQETTTMMTIRLSTISMAEMIEKEKTDTKKTCQHQQSSMATHVSEAQLVDTETCACEVVLV